MFKITWHDCSWRQIMTSHQKWRHHFIWSWNCTHKRWISKNADQAFLARVFCLILQRPCFWLIFSIFSKLEPKTFKIPTIFISNYFGRQNPEILLLLLWTTTQIDLKFSEHLQGIKVYSQKYGFLMTVFWLKVMAQNHSKSVFFQFFIFWSVKYTQNIVTSSNLLSKLIWTIVKTFTKFHCYAVSIEGVI